METRECKLGIIPKRIINIKPNSKSKRRYKRNIKKITTEITKTAEITIGEKLSNKRSKTTPWWNKECAKAVKNCKKSLYAYKKNKSIENLIALKRAKAVSRRTIRESKKLSWENYISTITKDTPMKLIWDKVRKIK